MGRTYLWVDGVQAEPLELDSEKLTHFIWVDPEDRSLGSGRLGGQRPVPVTALGVTATLN